MTDQKGETIMSDFAEVDGLMIQQLPPCPNCGELENELGLALVVGAAPFADTLQVACMACGQRAPACEVRFNQGGDTWDEDTFAIGAILEAIARWVAFAKRETAP